MTTRYDLPSREQIAALIEGGWYEARHPDAGRGLRNFAEGRLVELEPKAAQEPKSTLGVLLSVVVLIVFVLIPLFVWWLS